MPRYTALPEIFPTATMSLIEPTSIHGLPAIRLTLPNGAQATVSLRGGQLLSWIPPGGIERLYLSKSAVFDGSRSIRGGVPVCFPQFSDMGPLPKHGLLRTLDWSLSGQRVGDDFAWVSLEISDSEATRQYWPHPFRAEVTVGIEEKHLAIELEIENTGKEPFSFTGALHTYLRVAEVETTTLQGLCGLEYRDAANHNKFVREHSPALMVDAETDRVYHQPQRPLLLNGGQGSLAIRQEGFPDVVVWNPWEFRCRTLTDMRPDDFRHMLCVEAAIAKQPLTLAAGESWWGRQGFQDAPDAADLGDAFTEET